jgi:hypothetical protein
MAFAFSPVVEGSRFRVLEMRGGEKGGGKREEKQTAVRLNLAGGCTAHAAHEEEEFHNVIVDGPI